MEGEGKLFSNTLLLGASSVVSKMISFLLLPLYTNVLSPAEFGTVDILISTAILLLPIVSLHAPEAVFRFRAQKEEGAFSVGGLLIAVGLLLLALTLPFWGKSLFFAPYRGLLYFYVAASVCHSFLSHALRADGAFGLYALQQLFCAILTVLLQIYLLTIRDLGVPGYLLAVIFADAITFFVLLLTQAHRWRIRITGIRPLGTRMLRYALPLIPTAVLWWVMTVSDRYILLGYLGEEATGLYAAAGRLPSLLTFAVGVFLEAWHYTALRAGERDRSELFERIYGLFLPVLLVVGVAAILISGILVRLLLAREYAQAATLVPLLMLGTLCAGISNFIDSIYVLHYASFSSMLTSAASALLNVALNLLLIPRIGVIGAAISTVLSFAALLALRLWHTKRFLSFPRRGVRLVLTLSALMIGALFYGAEQPRLGGVICMLSLLFFAREIQGAARFLTFRGKALLRSFEKKKKIF